MKKFQKTKMRFESIYLDIFFESKSTRNFYNKMI